MRISQTDRQSTNKGKSLFKLFLVNEKFYYFEICNSLQLGIVLVGIQMDFVL